MAPEIILRQQFSFYSDFFSLGVIVYEMMFNRLPYPCRNRKEYIEALSKDEIFIRKNDDIPDEWSIVSADFVNRCLVRNCENRLGYNGIKELKEHKWFHDVDWDNLAKMNLRAQFVPDKKKNNFSKPKKREGKEFTKNIKNYIEFLEANRIFEGYFYSNRDHVQYDVNKNQNFKSEEYWEVVSKYVTKGLEEIEEDIDVKDNN